MTNNFFWSIVGYFLFCLWLALSFSSALTLICLWGALSAAVIAFFVNQHREHAYIPERWLRIWIILFFAAAVLSVTVSHYPKQSFRGLLKLVQQFIILFVVFCFFSSQLRLNQWRQWLLLSFTLVTANGVTQYVTGVDFLRGFYAQASSAGWRLSGSFETYGKFASYLVCVVPVVLFSTFHCFRKKELRQELILWIPLSLLGLFLLFATRSRGGVLAFIFGISLVFILRRLWKGLLVLFLAGIIGFFFLPRSMVIHLDRENKEQSIIERFELWHRAADVIRARPLTGTGINTYAVAHQQFDTRKNWRVQNYYAHNGYLQMAAEIGAPGLFFFLAFVFRWIWLYRPKHSDTGPEHDLRWGFLAGSLSFLILCLVDTSLHSPQPVMTFWFVMGMLGASASVKA